mmetsp:Transcript_10370/g.16919  ORF Transcript_10370/g.16919 Transcript_10370/m.16919 type:complete len:627 (+) Transcript_10370:481-2361(+)
MEQCKSQNENIQNENVPKPVPQYGVKRFGFNHHETGRHVGFDFRNSEGRSGVLRTTSTGKPGGQKSQVGGTPISPLSSSESTASVASFSSSSFVSDYCPSPSSTLRKTDCINDVDAYVNHLTRGLIALKSPRAAEECDIAAVGSNKKQAFQASAEGRPITSPALGLDEQYVSNMCRPLTAGDNIPGRDILKREAGKQTLKQRPGILSSGSDGRFGGRTPDRSRHRNVHIIDDTNSTTCSVKPANAQLAKNTDVTPSSNSLKRRRPGMKPDLQLFVGTKEFTRPMPLNTTNLDVDVDKNMEVVPIGDGEDTSSLISKYDREEEGCTKVLDHLYVGGLNAISKKIDCLDECGITAVVNCSSRGNLELNSRPQNLLELTLNLRDKSTQDIACMFFTAIRFIEHARENGGKVLVYCMRGISRSATIVLAYLVWKFKWTYEQALAFLKTKRSKVSPNVGFCIQLISFATMSQSISQGQSLVFKITMSDDRSWIMKDALPRSTREDHADREDDLDNNEKLPIPLAFGPVTDISSNMFTSLSSDSPHSYPVEERCWLVLTSTCQFIWHHDGTSMEILEGARVVAAQLAELELAGKEVECIKEGLETVPFWTALAAAQSTDVVLSPCILGRIPV